MQGHVTQVHRSEVHTFSKHAVPFIRLLVGLGVEGDAHCGKTVKHRSRVAQDPTQPNLRQVHLIAGELYDELRQGGFDVQAGQLGENITTTGLDLINLPVGTRLQFADGAVVELTGLRNPCAQIDQFRPGMLAAVLDRDAEGKLIRKAGVMGVVENGGEIRPGDRVTVVLPPLPHRQLERV
jgi:MOSC domain-containing protein YiiM